ncbi:MAG: metal ABC transporter solute-binding protein, Zn/Mn family [Acidimicrobiales bacterium]
MILNNFTTRAPSRGVRWARRLVGAALLAGSWLASGEALAGASPTKIVAIGAENEYANVIAQIGGRYVEASAIMSNPTTDPHTFEASPSVARQVSSARLIVQNGVGYDTFMGRLEQASPSSHRKVIVVQNLLGLPTDTPNPHLWYKPATAPKVAVAVEADLAAIDPAHAGYFAARLRAFQSSIVTLDATIANFKRQFAGRTVATTEPVADYLLSALGLDNLTPFRFQADIMNGVDPSPQDVSFQDQLFTKHKVKMFCYNAQVVSPVTRSLLALARSSHVPVVAVYETMPTPGYDFQTWMAAEIGAFHKALVSRVSTSTLL